MMLRLYHVFFVLQVSQKHTNMLFCVLSIFSGEAFGSFERMTSIRLLIGTYRSARLVTLEKIYPVEEFLESKSNTNLNTSSGISYFRST